jgi:hypothetical protein
VSGDDRQDGSARREGGAKRAWLWIFGLGTALAGVGFAVKIHEFLSDALAEEGIGFAGSHLLSYALVAGGFLLLLVGVFLRGHFADIERPKFDMLDREVLHDRAGRL